MDAFFLKENLPFDTPLSPDGQYCPVQILHARSARVSHAKTEVSGGRFSRLVDIFRVPRSKFSGIHLGGEATLYPPTLSKSLEIPAGNGQELPCKICAGHYCRRTREGGRYAELDDVVSGTH